MSYAQNQTIAAADFNSLVGGEPTSTVNTLNVVWGTGSGSAGYGQSAVANVSVSDGVASTNQWHSLVSNTSNAALHQGSSIVTVTPPVAGDVITYTVGIPTNLSTIYDNRLNASLQGSSVSNTVVQGSSWNNSLSFSFTTAFANGDAARYFFNAGGQIKISCSHPTGTGMDLLLSDLAANVGNIFFSSPTTGAVTIAGNAFSGVTKVDGGGNSPNPYLVNNGYYALTTANATVFSQSATTGPITYLDTNISVVIKSNGTQGVNGDTGSIITINVVWDQVPDGLTASAGSTTTVDLIYPETTFIANTWGSATLSGAVAGS